MSFVRFKKEPQLEEKTEKKELTKDLSIKIDVTPIPVGATKDISPDKRSRQTNALEKVRTEGKDLFVENTTVVSNTAGTRLYQTKDLYGQNIAVEDLIPMLTKDDLTLRINAIRQGVHAHSSCMELKSGVLASLLETAADDNNEKTATIALTSSEHGEMFVSVRQQKGKHYINKVDYKIPSVADDKLHNI